MNAHSAGTPEKGNAYLFRSHKNVFFCAAAGNFGPNQEVYPAHCQADNLLSVGAFEDSHVAPYSGKGEIYENGQAVLVSKSMYFIAEGERAIKAHDIEKASSCYEQALMERDHPLPLFRMGLIDQQEGRLDSAYSRLSRAVELAPDFAEANLSLGTILAQKGDFRQAQTFYKKAISLQPDNAMAHFNLGIAFMMLGSPREALQELKEVERIDPKYPQLREAIEEAEKSVK